MEFEWVFSSFLPAALTWSQAAFTAVIHWRCICVNLKLDITCLLICWTEACKGVWLNVCLLPCRKDEKEYALKQIEGTGISMSACREIAVSYPFNSSFNFDPFFFCFLEDEDFSMCSFHSSNTCTWPTWSFSLTWFLPATAWMLTIFNASFQDGFIYDH